MLYTELRINDESYKLRLTTKTSIALEKALGFNPITMLMEIDDGVMPKLGDCLTMLHSMLQTYHHGFTMEKVYDLFDKYVADGHNMFDLIPVFVEVFEQSGYITSGSNEATGEEVKN